MKSRRIIENMGEAESSGGLEFANSDESTEWGGHPLFPRSETETGPDRRRFDILHIIRTRADGTREVCPKAWLGTDLRSWEQIAEAYGGGTYQLQAQCKRTFRYQAFGEKVHIAGPSKPFVALNQSETRMPAQEIAPEPAPAPVAAAPMHSAAIPPGYGHPGPYAYPYPSHASPPPASGNAETLALVRAVIESSNAEKNTLMRALLERPGKETGPLEVVREILPLMQGGNGTQALMQGVELARGLIGPVHAAPPPAAQARPDDDFALLGQVLRMIAPATAVAAAAPAVAAPAPAPSPPPATLAPPPAAPPPGWAWAYTATGWVLVQLAHVQPYAAPMPAPAPAQAPTQPAANPGEPVKPSGSSATSSNPLGGLEQAFGDPELGKLLAGLSMLGGGSA